MCGGASQACREGRGQAGILTEAKAQVEDLDEGVAHGGELRVASQPGEEQIDRE